jgi:broad specificity phosphatase PhoE
MAEILLVRHGVPACDHRARIAGREFARWVAEYDEAALDADSVPPAELVTRARDAGCLVTSSLRRSVESCAVLAPGRTALRDPLFDETGIPTALPLPLALRPLHWDALARAAWLVGWSPDTESFRAASARANRGADALRAMAATHGSVMLIGHGMLNTLIARSLRRAGWRGTGSLRGYWDCCTFRGAT